MKHRNRSILVIALAVVMVLTMALGSFVSADDGKQTLNGSSSTAQTVLESGHYKITRDVTYASGIKIADNATVYIEIPAGLTLTCHGINGRGYDYWCKFWLGFGQSTDATPGIEVGEGAVLHITGEGSLCAEGGDGLAGQDGTTGTDIEIYCWSLYPLNSAEMEKEYIYGGTAGTGGQGAIAPAPAIGGKTGTPGQETSPAGGYLDNTKGPYESLGRSEDGGNGSSGSAMGTVYIEGSVSVTATAGGGDYNLPGKGGVETRTTYYKTHAFKGYTMLAGFLSLGAPGGGGSAANPSAIIGGGGGAGGAGGSGLCGSCQVKSGTIDKTFDFTKTYTNGADGTTAQGGSGGLSYQLKASGYDKLKAGVGGTKGGNGAGGTLYITEAASVNGISGKDLTRSDLGGETTETQGQGAKVVLLTRVEVTAKLGEDPYTNRSIYLTHSSLGKIDLEEMANTPGTYFGYIPTGATNLKIYADSEFTSYTIDAPTTATVTQSLQFETCQVNLSLDGGSYGSVGDHKITFMKGSTLTNTFTEETAGLFKANICLSSDGEDNYEIYVDGVDYEKSMTVARGAVVEAPFYTMTVKVDLNSSGSVAGYEGRQVTLNKGDRFAARMDEETTGVYKAIVPGEDASGVIAYTIGIGDDRSENLLTAETGAETTITYYNIAITLSDDGQNWKNVLVNIMGDGKLKNAPEVLSGTQGTGVYKVILFGEDATTYSIVTDGVVTQSQIQATDPAKRDITVNFFTARVELTKDGKNWDKDASVMLKRNGDTAYVLPYDSSSKTYTAKGIEANTYDVFVYGTASPADTGVTISDGTKETIDYFTITYHKNIEGSTSGDKVQVYQENTVPTVASAPYEAGYTFIRWKTGAEASSADYIPAAVTSPVEVYASWVRPQVSLGELVRCTETGVTAQNGPYFRFTNLAVQGYPLESPVIGTMTVALENVKLISTDMPAGWENTGKWDLATGNGKYIFQMDTGSKLTVADAQTYLRSLIFERNSNSGSCSVQVSVYGNTTVK